jgi:hypothetical protein
LRGSADLARKFSDAEMLATMLNRNRMIVDVDTTSESILADVLAERGDTPLIARTASKGGYHCYYGFNLPSFPATDKIKDTRYRWFTSRYGDRCWELDAMDPRALRDCVEAAIKEQIEPDAWAKCDAQNKEEKESMRFVIDRWINPGWGDPIV